MADCTEEIEIPTPWGFIAAKTWGDKSLPPILAVHGLQDNAGSFDRLIPLLPSHYFYVCIDLPDHGKSSHFPAHMLFRLFDCVLALKYVTDYYKWESVILMGHSLGCHICVFYSFLYPQLIKALIVFDAICMYPIQPSSFTEYYTQRFETYMSQEIKSKYQIAPLYTYDEALNLLLTKRPTSLTTEAATSLLKRMLIPDGDKFRLSMAQGLKNFIRESMSVSYLAQLVKKYRYKFPHLIVLSKESKELSFFVQLEPALQEFKKNKRCRVVEVEGNHDVHNNHPERVAPYVHKFLLQNRSKL